MVEVTLTCEPAYDVLLLMTTLCILPNFPKYSGLLRTWKIEIQLLSLDHQNSIWTKPQDNKPAIILMHIYIYIYSQEVLLVPVHQLENEKLLRYWIISLLARFLLKIVPFTVLLYMIMLHIDRINKIQLNKTRHQLHLGLLQTLTI